MIRRNILSDDQARLDFIEGVHLLKQEPWTDGLGTYDFFIYWHHQAMMTATPDPPVPFGSRRNAAHSGPVFLPWHRYMLIVLENQLRRVLGKDEFRLPYWNWTADANDPLGSGMWDDDVMGGTGDPVGSGPFQRFGADGREWEVRLTSNPMTGGLELTSRGMRRNLGGAGSIPSGSTARSAIDTISSYDTSPWDGSSSGSFRNTAEGPLHNIVHVWVGGDMVRSTSPNDPLFFLHHCNVDRIYRAWQERFGLDIYSPAADAPVHLMMHRLNDTMFNLFNANIRPADVLNVDTTYTYDSLAF